MFLRNSDLLPQNYESLYTMSPRNSDWHVKPSVLVPIFDRGMTWPNRYKNTVFQSDRTGPIWRPSSYLLGCRVAVTQSTKKCEKSWMIKMKIYRPCALQDVHVYSDWSWRAQNVHVYSDLSWCGGVRPSSYFPYATEGGVRPSSYFGQGNWESETGA